jgi:hypothetical protein
MKLLLATPCQFVITDVESSLGHSLIAVFHDIGIKVPPSTDVPSNALLPKEWAIFSKWKAEKEEEATKHYTLQFAAYWPDGTALVEQEIKSNPLVEGGMAFIVRNTGFPIGQNGIVKVILSLMADGVPAHEPVVLDIGVKLTKDL